MPDIEKKGVELKVSRRTYAAVRDALAAQSKRKLESPDRNAPIMIMPDDSLVDPIDWQLANVRKDAASYAAQIFQHTNGDANANEFIELATAISDFIVNGKDKEEAPKQDGWSK